LSSLPKAIFASGVEGDTTTVLSDKFALEDAADALARLYMEVSAYKCHEMGRVTYECFEICWRMNDGGRGLVGI
jgi:hypothetical protein